MCLHFYCFRILVFDSTFANRYFQGKAGDGWSILQWVTSGLLWSVWLMQDAANIAVFCQDSLIYGSY